MKLFNHRIVDARGLLLGCILSMVMARISFGLGEESVGNDPLNKANYTDFPGIMPIVNDKARVYRIWVNGNEYFYFKGDTAAFNKALQHFAKAGGTVHEVVVRPEPGKASTFQEGNIDYDWHLHILGGIAKHMTTRDKGALVWPANPTMTVYIGKQIKLEQLKVPKGVTLVELKDLKQRYIEALKSKDQSVRGWTCGQLMELDPYDPQSVKVIAGMLKDEKDWVRQNAVGALAGFGTGAKAVVPTLKEMAKTANDRMKETIAKTIAAIEQGVDTTKAATAHGKTIEAISKFKKANE